MGPDPGDPDSRCTREDRLHRDRRARTSRCPARPVWHPARMSDSPHHGATDPHGKFWGTDRIYVADGSLHVTNGGANPVLTIMALAWRTAARLAAIG
ncbi:GMC oxidoreductase [Streptomyces sviceus]|uniref:GMC oxidoreductase n=1 Tax=Streptomyces sviceus TaxID=285530 RepID=UPI00367CB58E